jgi:hypothetical protein
MKHTHVHLAVLLTVTLATGCATHEHKINNSDSANAVSATLIHGNPSLPDRLVVEAGVKRYEGELTVKKHLEWSKVRKTYGLDSKHWQKISSGLDKDHHTSVGIAEAKSSDGETMQCRLVWTRTDHPEGECVSQNGTPIPLHFH